MADNKTKIIHLIKKAIYIIALLFVVSSFVRPLFIKPSINESTSENIKNGSVEKGKEYSSYEEVAKYIHLFKELPPNYINNNEARKKGWKGGNPQNELGGNAYIGGDRFANLEKILPTNNKYYECDVDYTDDERGPNRLIYTADGKVYYTNNHYESYIELY